MDCAEAWQTDVPAGSGQQYSLYFGGVGSDDYLTSQPSDVLPAGNAPRTICAWTKSADGAVNAWAEHMINYGAAVSNQAFGAMMYTGNTWYAYVHSADLNTQIAVDTEWHNHCAVYDGAALTYYLDGSPAANADIALDTAANTAMVIGNRPDLEANAGFDGWVDDVRLYNRVLSEAEIQSLLAPVVQVETQVDASAEAQNGTAYPPNTFRFVDLADVVSNLETPTVIDFVAAPWNALTGLEIDVNGEVLLSETYEGDGIAQQQVRVDWLPPAEGVYHVGARATDVLSGAVTISRTVFVDATPPTASMINAVFTGDDYIWGSGVVLAGVLDDTTGVISATAVLDMDGVRTELGLQLNPDTAPVGHLRGDPVYASAPWITLWRPADVNAPPAYAVGVLELTVYDATQTPTTIQLPVTFDLQAPNPGDPTILINGAPAVANQIYTTDSVDLSVSISPTLDASGVSLWYGWSTSITTTADVLTTAEAPEDGVQLDQQLELSAADGAQTLYFHLVSVDGFANVNRQVYGPYVVDAPGMPDLVHMPQIHGSLFVGPHREWQTNGCTLLGTDPRMDPAQALYLTRDDSLLHILWTGADWETDGDLFVYLDTLPGQGGLVAYNPYASTAQSTVLLLPTGADTGNPMQADYALWVVDSQNAHLLRWDGADWIDDGLLGQLGGAYTFSHEPDAIYTDLVIPLTLIGDPGAALDLVAFAADAEEGPSQGLRLRSALPYANPVDSAWVVANAPDADQPHRMVLTDRYTVPLTAGWLHPARSQPGLPLDSQGATDSPTILQMTPPACSGRSGPQHAATGRHLLPTTTPIKPGYKRHTVRSIRLSRAV
ncbi:MAG: LamG domain-containing protein [Caldilineaceae bacterium]